LLTALAQQLDTDSVTWREKTTVTAVKPHQITTGSQCYTFDQVFDCRGLGAQADYADLRGMRGELVWLQAPNVKISRPIRLMHPRYRIYIVPRDDYYVVGASTIDSEDHSPISVRSLLELLSAAYSLDKGFSEARVLRTLVNCRPVFADHLPRIYRQPGLLAINGLYRHGYLLAPAVIEQALNLLAAQTTDTADFSKLIIKQ
jgi:glycine oxidase